MAQASSAIRVMALSDTHLRVGPEGWLPRWLPATAEPYLKSADVILHAGDVVESGVLDRLRTYAPLHVVLGNNDVDLVDVLPQTVSMQLAGVRIAMVHDSGATAGRAQRLRRRFPDADVVVFGHSHVPMLEEGVDGQLLLNPGSPTQRRAQPRHTLGHLLLHDGRVVESRVVALD